MKNINNIYCTILISFLSIGLFAQVDNKEEVLFSYNDIPVEKSEFIYVYEKNNLNETDLYSKKSVEEYLDLYVNFKLKVHEAESLKLDKTTEFRQEFDRYKKQLAQSYLNDRQISDEMIMEAHKRSKEERLVSHILIMCPPDADPADTLRIYNEMQDVYKEISSGVKSFEQAARIYSEDTMVNLGYFTVFQTVYPFENGMYETKVGTVSKPLRTQFGYHIVNVEDTRPAKGKVEVAYILFKVPKRANEEMKDQIRERAYMVHDSLKSGASFESMAKKYSEDKSTAFNGGRWKWISTGEALERFEKVAFSLEKPGDYSEPILTPNGWYIIRSLNKRVIGEYEEMKSELQRKILRDSRSESARQVYIQKLKKEYGYKDNQTGYVELTDRIDIGRLNKGNWKVESVGEINDWLFTVGPKDFYQKDFANFIAQNQNRKEVKSIRNVIKRVDWMYDAFLERELLRLEEAQLEEKYPEFKRLLKEYRDGIILFELTKDKVWDRASKDTLGLKEFYENNSNVYVYDQRVNAKIFNCKDAATAQELAPILIKREKKRKKGKSHKSMSILLAKFNIGSGNNKNVSYEEGTFEKGQNEIIDAIKWQPGISRTFENEDGTVTIVLVEDLIDPSPKPLNECKGFVISDYNDELEKTWVKELKEKYEVKINNNILKSIPK